MAVLTHPIVDEGRRPPREGIVGRTPRRRPSLSPVAAPILVMLSALALGLAAPLAEAAPGAAILAAASEIPASLGAGTSDTVAVRVVNTGDVTWTAGQLFRLGAGPSNQVWWSGFPCGGYSNRPADARVFLCRDVPPGDTYQFRFTLTLPPGTATSASFAVRMVRDGVAWFGEATSWTIAVSAPNAAEFRPAESLVPATLARGTAGAVSVRVVNTGSVTWTAGALYRLGASPTNELAWTGFGCGGYMNGPGDGRVFLCHDVPPGTSHDFRFQVLMPSGASTPKRLSLRMVRDGVEWFGPEQAFTIAPEEGCPSAALPTRADRWRLEIWDNRALGGDPVERRYGDPGPDGFAFDWGGGRPSACTGDDDYGVRFTRLVDVPASGDYTFVTTTDDGVRLWVDGVLLIDRWQDQPPTTWRAARFLAAGSHALVMDYYENVGGARAELRWEPVVTEAEAQLYGMNVDPANPSGHPSPQQLRDLGVRWVRIEWKAPVGEAFYDPVIAAYRAAGLEVLLLVDYASVPPKPASNASDAAWLDYLGTFSARVQELAAHYGDGVDAWQIWNEPDLLRPGTAYDPGVPARHFGAMLRDAVAAIRPSSSRPIVTGGLASGDPGYLRAARDAVGGLAVDAIAVHPYGQRAPDGWPRPDWGFGDMSDLFDRYLAFGRPLWVSEIGTADEPIQADYLENVYRLARNAYPGRVEGVFWFCWSDGMVPPFGLFRATGEPKPARDRYDSLSPPW
jgi:hypothetical protein